MKKFKTNKNIKVTGPKIEEIDNLLILYDQERFVEAEKLAKSLTTRFPQHAIGWKILGAVLKRQNRLEEAVPPMRRAVTLQPDDYAAQSNLGLVLMSVGAFVEAQKCYRTVVTLKPDFSEAHNNLGIIYKEQGRFAESESSFRSALQHKPDYAEAFFNLANNLNAQGRLCEAEEEYRQALKYNPGFVEVYNNLGINLQKQGQLLPAEKCCLQAIKLKPAYAEAYNNLGIIYQDQGCFRKSESAYRQALQLKPGYVEAMSNLLFLMNYHPDKSAEEIYKEYMNYNSRFGLPFQKEWRVHTNSRKSNRRLKVGYVSGDFIKHSVSHFLEPFLERHNLTKVEVYAYADIATEDDLTTKYKKIVNHWIPTFGMTDGELAERIRFDGIDILVDLAGHTAKNRLGVFARKPAPVSISWMGYGYTTGLTAIDYYLTDTVTVPIGSEGLFSETPWPLTKPYVAYRPALDMGEVSRLPVIGRGYITFGTLSRAIRINHRTIRVWAEILSRIPGSHLVINSGNFRDPVMQSRLAEKFIELGIERERLEIGYSSPPWDVMRNIDIGLDCFPHNSGTTLVENLYMGIPFVTLAGRPSVGRLGAYVLEAVGHPEWIAESEDDYVERALILASDITQLEVIRSGLRGEMKSGALMDERGSTGRVETAYRQMFAKWCEMGGQLYTKDEQKTVEFVEEKFDEIFQQALSLHRSGDFQEAEAIYERLLQVQPSHSILNYNLGILAVQLKRPAAGLPYFQTALEANPEDSGYWLSYIDALDLAGKTEDAMLLLDVAREAGLKGEEVDSLAVQLRKSLRDKSNEKGKPQ